MSRPSCIGILSWFRKRVCDEAVFGRGRQGADGRWIGRCWYSVDETHVANIIEIYLFFEYDGEALAVEAHCQNCRRECELAYYRSSLCVKKATVSGGGSKCGWLRRTFVFCMTRWRGDRIKATRDVENNISIIAMLPSSLLKMRENGSVW